jgi:magnesium-transporting ATPase (P-type)
MSNVPPSPPPRHALGLPAGSIRALLALSVLALLWLLALQPLTGHGQPLGELQLPTVFMDLQILMVLILAHFFAAHGHTIRAHAEQRSPLGLPRGSVRFLLLAGYLGLAVFLYRTQPKFEYPSTSALILLLVLISAFFLGHLLTGAVRLLSGGVLPYWFQDIQAWVALLAILCMGVLLIILLFINPSLSLGQEISPPLLEAILAALVGFYFGARS